jgi:hypothetical protein
MKYKNKIIALTTIHGKEKAIAPSIKKILKASICEINHDTDLLGTFSGEVDRIGSVEEVLKRKCLLGCESSSIPYGIASEGSFIPYPPFPFIGCDSESMLFLDLEDDIAICESLISTETNFNKLETDSLDEALSFAETALFPSHAIIIRPNIWEDKSIIFKGIQIKTDLEIAFTEAKKNSSDEKIKIETDMRAHMNPSRMKVIAALAEKLATRIASPCVKCNTPGFGIIRMEPGLHCEYCDAVTKLVKYEIYGCAKCGHEVSKLRSDGKLKASQSECEICNP